VCVPKLEELPPNLECTSRGCHGSWEDMEAASAATAHTQRPASVVARISNVVSKQADAFNPVRARYQ
jgi:hypothetical protein